MSRALILATILAIFIPVSCGASVQTWTVAQHESDSIVFTFDGTNLNIYGSPLYISRGDWFEMWYVWLDGRWAAAGTYSAAGVLSPDPYASFVIDSPAGYHYSGWGHIVWSPDTPAGYVAPIVVGRSGTYLQDYVELDTWTQYSQITHTFYATVPEPASVLALGMGLAGLAAVRRLRSRRDRS